MHHRAFPCRALLLLGMAALLCGGCSSGSGSLPSNNNPNQSNGSGSGNPASGGPWSLLPDPYNNSGTRTIWDLGVAPNGSLYAAGQGGVAVSSDGGQHWNVINNGLTGLT